MERKAELIDTYGRRISYVRLSVTDRCDLRCRYCMAEQMKFLPRADLLTLEELVQLADAFIARGVTRIRLTGGEPLVRRGIETLVRWLGERLGHGLEELTLTTNGTQLERFAADLYAAGVRRVNVSLDSLRPDRFRHVMRRGARSTAWTMRTGKSLSPRRRRSSSRGWRRALRATGGEA